ncbi:MAG: hypothetical protein WCI86_03730 [Actinomycetota bacterium]
MIFRKLAAIVAIIGLAGGLSLPAGAADTPDEQYVLIPPSDSPNTFPTYGISANGIGEFPTNINYLFGKKSDGGQLGVSKITSVGFCTSLTDSACAGAAVVQYKAQLGICATPDSTDCISDITVKGQDGSNLAISATESFPGARSGDFTGDSKAGLPSGGATPLITVPGLPHAGGNKYLLVVSADGYRLPNNTKFDPANIKAAIYAVRIEQGGNSLPGVQSTMNWYDRLDLNLPGWTNPTTACPIYSLSECAKPYSLPVSAQFGFKLRLSNPVKGWLHGRMDGVTSDISVDATGNQLISIQGNPIIVPSAYGWVKKAEAIKSIADFYDKMKKPIGGNGFGCTNDPNGGRATNGCAPEFWVSFLRHLRADQESMDEFLAWMPEFKDKASKAPTIWRWETMGSDGSNDTCYRNSSNLSGFVTTNATQYLSGPPVFNKAEESLDYKVAAPHYLPDGKEFLGSYNLVINAQVARCLYGFTDAPIQASVSVTSSDGQARVATTSLVERGGWLKLSANGFTFSNPIVKVKLSQEKVVVAPTPTPSASATPTPIAAPAAAKKSSITCVKGKTTKKVTAVNPKCPTGYKKR